jgi:hypothetical protein
MKLEDFNSRKEFDTYVIRNADAFYASAFRGRGEYATSKSNDLEGARSAARVLYEDRPVMIYAVKGMRQVHVENWAP